MPNTLTETEPECNNESPLIPMELDVPPELTALSERMGVPVEDLMELVLRKILE